MIDVEDDFEVEVMKGGELLRRLVEGVWIECQRTVAGVPAVGTIAGAQINQSVARQPLVTEGLCDAKSVFRPGECAMGLQITEHPFGRHRRAARETDKLCQRIGRLIAANDEQFQRFFTERSALTPDPSPI